VAAEFVYLSGMREISVDPEDLRRAAGILDVDVRRAEAKTTVPDSRNLGHAELSAAVGEFVQALTGGWMEAVTQADDLVSGLRDSAEIFERADAKGGETLRALKDGR